MNSNMGNVEFTNFVCYKFLPLRIEYLGHRKLAGRYTSKLPLTSVSGSIFGIYTSLLWFIHYIYYWGKPE